MPFPISLERDLETGLDRYVVVASDGFATSDAHELCDWVAAAAQNPNASFRLDLAAVDPDGRALAIVMAQTALLRAERRIELVVPGATATAA